MPAEQLSQSYEVRIEETLGEFSKEKRVETNNRRWIELSKNSLDELQTIDKSYKKRKIILLIAAPILLIPCAVLGTYLFGTAVIYPLIAETLCLGMCGWTMLDGCLVHNDKKTTNLDPSQINNVTTIFNEILNGKIRKECRIKEFGILSEEVYSKFKNLVDEKKEIENEYSQSFISRHSISINELKEKHASFEEKMKAWDTKWNEFKPELEADFPDINFIPQDSFNPNEIIPV